MVLAFVHLYTMFMIVPIFNSMMRIDRALLEAARDAGATGWQTLWNVVVPLSRTGILIGSIFVITIVMGDFVTVGVMGGQQIASVGKIIQVQTSYLQFPAGRGQRGGPAGGGADDHRGLTRAGRHAQGALTWRRVARSAATRPASFWLLALRLRAVRAVPLRPDDHDLRAVSFQGPEGGLTFPMRGVSLHWFGKLCARASGVVDIGAAFRRSLRARRRGDGAHGAAVACWPAWRSARGFRGGNAAVLRLGGEPDHAVDHRVARHRAAVPAARHRHQGARSTAWR